MKMKSMLLAGKSLMLVAILGLCPQLQTFADDNTPAQPKLSSFPRGRISVVAPEYCATVKGDTKIEFRAPGIATVVATCWMAAPGGFGSDSQITPEPIKLESDGVGSFVFPADKYPHGPITVRIIGSLKSAKVVDKSGKSEDVAKVADNCYLQLFNDGGIPEGSGLKDVPIPAPAEGMDLTYSDDFDAMPTITRTGENATYCSLKPDGTEFGDAVFADHEGKYDPFFQTGTYLRIRMVRRPDLEDPMHWKRKNTTGFLSSERVDGTGFHTGGEHDQYFECRMAYGAAPGTWPAFWTLSALNYKGATKRPCNELDILESYMPWADTYHITPHEWGYNEGKAKGEYKPEVTKIGGTANVCQTFHTYGCLIQKDVTTYYFDNVKVYTHPTLKYSWTDGNYFMINLAFQDRKDAYVNGNFERYGGIADLWVDWVRVYEKK